MSNLYKLVYPDRELILTGLLTEIDPERLEYSAQVYLDKSTDGGATNVPVAKPRNLVFKCYLTECESTQKRRDMLDAIAAKIKRGNATLYRGGDRCIEGQVLSWDFPEADKGREYADFSFTIFCPCPFYFGPTQITEPLSLGGQGVTILGTYDAPFTFRFESAGAGDVTFRLLGSPNLEFTVACAGSGSYAVDTQTGRLSLGGSVSQALLSQWKSGYFFPLPQGAQNLEVVNAAGNASNFRIEYNPTYHIGHV
jgi:hypothetical protein